MQIDIETRNVIIHNAVMVGITIIFMIYFGLVENSERLREQIDKNINIIPIAQLLAYEGYVGYIVVKQIRRLQEKRKYKRTLSNVVTVGSHVFHEYVTSMIDLIGISIITFSFFIYAYPKSSHLGMEIMDISNAYFLIFAPSMGIVIHKLFSRRKIEYR